MREFGNAESEMIIETIGEIQLCLSIAVAALFDIWIFRAGNADRG